HRVVSKNQWHMVSIPRPIEIIWQNFVADSILQIFRWDNNEENYFPVHSFLDKPRAMGEAVWMFSKYNFPINISNHEQAGLDDSLSTPIEKGWNQVGIPVSYTTSWKDMSFIQQNGTTIPLAKAVSDNLITDAVYWYEIMDGDVQGYKWSSISEASAEPWKGYWLKSEVAGTLVFSTTATEIINSDSGLLFKKGADQSFNISLGNDNYLDDHNIFGINDNQMPKNDISEPPHIGSYCALYFADQNQRLTRQL
ncbi:MAG: hypothetical protein GY808_09410, partial [Gammaproteobacteria bacterium]|nr:hypothetical protein [Gammaproteobacteria bacterium]